MHPRTQHVKKAELEMREMFSVIAEKYDLTFGETVRILAYILDEEGRGIVRQERHPDDLDAKGDEASDNESDSGEGQR